MGCLYNSQEAVWHDGEKITPEDVIWTFNTLMEKGHPFYKYYYEMSWRLSKINDNKVKFNFKGNTNLELPLIVGQLPVLPKHYWKIKILKKHLWIFHMEVAL